MKLIENIVNINDTTIDYPGKLAKILYVKHCNLKCPYCYNLKVLQSIPNIDEVEIMNELEAEAEFYDGMVICGGEPTLYEDLEEFIMYLHDLNLSVKVDTNGYKFERTLYADHVALDYKYPIKDYIEKLGMDPTDTIEYALPRLGDEDIIRTTVTVEHENMEAIMLKELTDLKVKAKWIVNKYFDREQVLERKKMTPKGWNKKLDDIYGEFQVVADKFNNR
jgi:pyruvate formate lyase activating enzyme